MHITRAFAFKPQSQGHVDAPSSLWIGAQQRWAAHDVWQAPSLLSVRKTATISDLRRSPTHCFEDGTVAVTQRGETVGYPLSPEQLEIGLDLLARIEDPRVLKERLGLTEFWLQCVSSKQQP